MMMNHVGDIAKTMSQHMDGMSPTVIELNIAVVAKDPEHIATSTKDMATYLKMDPEATNSLMDVMMCDFNPANTEQQKSYGLAELAVKRTFNQLAPELPIADKLSDLSRLTLERDITPIMEAMETVFPDAAAAEPVIKLFRILTLAHTGKKGKLKKELMSMLKELMKENDKAYFDTFSLLN